MTYDDVDEMIKLLENNDNNRLNVRHTFDGGVCILDLNLIKLSIRARLTADNELIPVICGIPVHISIGGMFYL